MIWHSVLIVILTVIFGLAAYAFYSRKPAPRAFVNGRQVTVLSYGPKNEHGQLVSVRYHDTGTETVVSANKVLVA